MASQQAPPPVGADDSRVRNTHGITKRNNPNANSVQRTRAWTGLWVVVGGDVAIAAAAIFAVFTVWKTGHTSGSITPIVAILTSAFTAISTMTTAYFGIKTMSNTAQSFAPAVHAAASGGQGQGNPPLDPQRGGTPPEGTGGQPPPPPYQPGYGPPGQRPSTPTGPSPTRPSPPTGPSPASGLAGLGLAPPDAPSPSGTFLAAPTIADPDLLTEFVDVELLEVELTDVELTEFELGDVELDEVELTDVELDEVELTDVELGDVELADAELTDGTDEPQPEPTDADRPLATDAESEE